ncbi:MAG: FAD:protein FMN transferase [Candidatus Margulisiibacteriota bacterium]
MPRLAIRYVLVALAAAVIAMMGGLLMMPSHYQLEGLGLGVPYRIWLQVPRYKGFPYEIQSQADVILKRAEGFLSHDGSQVASFNALQSTLPVTVDPWLYQALEAAQRISVLTGGAYDVTTLLVGGVRQPGTYRYLELLSENRIRKTVPELTIEVSSLLRGLAVDQIAYLLTDEGIPDFVIEVGESIRVQGRPAPDRKWRIGVSYPGSKTANLAMRLAVENRSVATRSLYQQTVVDPRTGLPVLGPLASVTVVSNSCMWAEALATALMAMTVNDGLPIATQFPDTEALFISRGTARQPWVMTTTPGFAIFVVH